MSILRVIGKVLGVFIFSIFLGTSIFTASFIELTEYDNLKPIVVDLFSKQLTENVTEEQISETHSSLLYQCTNKETIEMPVNEINITLNCSKIREVEAEELSSLIGVELLNKIYYEKYECEFIECLQEAKGYPIVLFSAHANNFFKSVEKFLWIGTAIGAIILFISLKTWSGRLKNFGIVLIFTGIPYFLLNFIKGYIPAEVMAVVSPLVDQIFNSISTKLLIVFTLGVILTALGYSLKYLIKKKKS